MGSWVLRHTRGGGAGPCSPGLRPDLNLNLNPNPIIAGILSCESEGPTPANYPPRSPPWPSSLRVPEPVDPHPSDESQR